MRNASLVEFRVNATGTVCAVLPYRPPYIDLRTEERFVVTFRHVA